MGSCLPPEEDLWGFVVSSARTHRHLEMAQRQQAPSSWVESSDSVIPTEDAAACMAAGISITFGLQKYGQALDGMTLAQRREEIRMSVGTLNDETLYGQIRFNRFNQNNGRMSVNWQILEDGGTRLGRHEKNILASPLQRCLKMFETLLT